MKLFNFLPVAFCIGVQALPAALPEAAAAPAAISNALPAVEIATAPILSIRAELRRRAGILSSIEATLKSLDLKLTSTVDEVLAKLGLSAVDSDIDALLTDLVGDVDSLLDKVDSIVDSTLEGLGLGGLVTTIGDVEAALGLSSSNTIGSLLSGLGLL